MKCSVCDHDLKTSLRECPNCGAVLGKRQSLPIQPPLCPDCGTQNPLQARFCSHCGKSLIKEKEEKLGLLEIVEWTEDIQPLSGISEPKQAEPGPSPLPQVQGRVIGTPAPRIKITWIIFAVGGIAGMFCLRAVPMVCVYGLHRSPK